MTRAWLIAAMRESGQLNEMCYVALSIMPRIRGGLRGGGRSYEPPFLASYSTKEALIVYPSTMESPSGKLWRALNLAKRPPKHIGGF